MPGPAHRPVADARAFLRDLAAHNSRDRFTARKPTHDSRLRAPAPALHARVAADLTRLTGAPTAPARSGPGSTCRGANR